MFLAIHFTDETESGGEEAAWLRMCGPLCSLQSATWQPAADDKTYELQWTKVGCDFVGALYHPPKPLYSPESLLNYIEANVNEINQTFPQSMTTLAGDFNQLSDTEVIERTGLTSTDPRRQHFRPHLRVTALLQFCSCLVISRQK